MDSIALRQLLGYKAPSKENGHPSYNLVPTFMWKDCDTKVSQGFMLHPVFPRVSTDNALFPLVFITHSRRLAWALCCLRKVVNPQRREDCHEEEQYIQVSWCLFALRYR